MNSQIYQILNEQLIGNEQSLIDIILEYKEQMEWADTLIDISDEENDHLLRRLYFRTVLYQTYYLEEQRYVRIGDLNFVIAVNYNDVMDSHRDLKSTNRIECQLWDRFCNFNKEYFKETNRKKYHGLNN